MFGKLERQVVRDRYAIARVFRQEREGVDEPAAAEGRDGLRLASLRRGGFAGSPQRRSALGERRRCDPLHPSGRGRTGRIERVQFDEWRLRLGAADVQLVRKIRSFSILLEDGLSERDTPARPVVNEDLLEDFRDSHLDRGGRIEAQVEFEHAEGFCDAGRLSLDGVGFGRGRRGGAFPTRSDRLVRWFRRGFRSIGGERSLERADDVVWVETLREVSGAPAVSAAILYTVDGPSTIAESGAAWLREPVARQSRLGRGS